MIDIRALDKDIDQMSSLKGMVKIFGEIAASNMNRTRESVLHSRDFLESIYEIFDEVRKSYVRELLELKTSKMKNRGDKLTLLSHNGKTVAVFLSANTKLYGDLVQKVFRLFMNDVRNHDSEATIIGKVGVNMFLQEEPDRPYTSFDLPDDKAPEEYLTNILKHLVEYERIRVYYGKYKNTIKQEPTFFELSADLPMPQDVIHDKEKNPDRGKYIFEPSLEEVLMFFEKQIFGALFGQTVLESQLSKYAARLVAMDRAEQSISESLKKLNIRRMAMKHKLSNRKQLNSMGAVLKKTRGRSDKVAK